MHNTCNNDYSKENTVLIHKNNVCFSVIMPCYNSESYVKEAISSVIEQTYPCWELILINDGSTDETLTILEDFAAKDSRIKVYSKENGGYVSAVNTGLDKITGDYFLMMGSDDALGKELFSQLANCCKNRQPDCITWRTVLTKGGEVLGIDSCTKFFEAVSVYDTSFSQFSKDYPAYAEILFVRDTSKCYKRCLLDDLRYFGKFGLDADGIFSMLLCHRAHSFAVAPVDGYYWTLREDSVSAQKSNKAKNCDRVENWMKFYTNLSQLDNTQIADREKEYLDAFWNSIDRLWVTDGPFLSNYSIIKQALKIYHSFSKKVDYAPALAWGKMFFVRFPILWKICGIMKIRETVNKIRAIKYK